MQKDIPFEPPENRLKLTAYVRKYPREFLLQAVGGILYNTVVVFGAIFLGKAIDAANLVLQGQADLPYFYANLFGFLGFTLLFQAARYFKRYYMREIVNRMKCDIRAGLLAAFFRMPLVALNGEKVGDMMSRMIGDVEQVGQSVQTTITELWDTCLLMLSYFVACMIYSPKITLLAAIPIPFTVLMAQMIRRPLYTLSQKSRSAASGINVHLQHNVSGIALLRLFGLEEKDRNLFSKLLDEQLKWNVLSTALQNGMTPIYILTATLGIVLVVGMGGERVVNGSWSIGVFTAYLSMFTAMSVRTNVAARVMNTWHGAKASWDRICEKMGIEQPDIAAPEETPPEDGCALIVDALSFRYPFSGEDCLHDISFCAKPGELIGITGPVGSGKSALAAALSGLYPYGGEVTVNGVDLSALESRRQATIAYMDAEHFVFSDDVAFNISLGEESGDLDAALSLAELEPDIEGFPDGMHTRLMERGVRISGGQRQRISLARAWNSPASVLLLDDPFSAIDISMERRIMRNIRERQGDRIILLFSHRLFTFPLTDRVIVLEKGRIGQAGTHEELLNEPGVYRDIFLAQEFMRGDSHAE
jgi:ABC-type multidrug transport system fused ATPase/permease subunit